MSNPPINTNIKLKNTKLLASIGSILVLFSGLGPAYAQETELKIALGPPIVEREVLRGQVLEERITIVNKSEVPLPFKIVARNWTAKGETGDIEFVYPELAEGVGDPAATLAFNPRAWFTFDAADILLQPEERRRIQVAIRVPENAEPGGHYVMVNFETLLPSQFFQQGQPRILPQIGSLFFLTVIVPDFIPLKQPFAFEEFSIPKDQIRRPLAFLQPIPVVRAAANIAFIDRALKTLTLRIKNEDVIHYRPQGEVQVLNTFGQVVARYDIPETTILPGKVRLIPIDLVSRSGLDADQNLSRSGSGADQNADRRGGWLREQLIAGRYTALVRIGEGDQVLQAKVQVWAFPWLIVFLWILIFTPIAYFVVKWRKRLKPALLALFGKYAKRREGERKQEKRPAFPSFWTFLALAVVLSLRSVVRLLAFLVRKSVSVLFSFLKSQFHKFTKKD